MSLKLPKRLSSKKKKRLKCSAQMELLCSLGLEDFRASPLGPASMLDISTWVTANPDPVKLPDLPYSFLRRLWLLSPDARSPTISFPSADAGNGSKPTDAIMNEGENKKCALNPLDLVTAVFMSSNSFLQQEIVSRMVRCGFAVPLVLPNIDQEKNYSFLLWPLRHVYSQWRCFCPNQKVYTVHEGDLASTPMPLVSFVRIGHGGVSKSQILNIFMSSEAFLHKGSTGGDQPHRLANGMVEIAWYLPRGEANTEVFSAPVVFANLRGDACGHDKSLALLCQTSTVIVVFCGTLQEKECKLVSFCKNAAKKAILVSNSADIESSAARFFDQSNGENFLEDALRAQDVNVEDLANSLACKLKEILTEKSTHVTLLAVSELALKIGLNVDEGLACRKALALAEQVLEDLNKGSAQYQETQLPLQGHLWRKLAEIEKEERKHKTANKDVGPDRQKEKKDVLEQLSNYKITPAMEMFIDALFTNSKIERTYFLSWMKLKLTQIQSENPNGPEDVRSSLRNINGLPERPTESENKIWNDEEDSDSFCTDSSFEVETVDESAELQNPQCRAQEGLEDFTVREQLCPKPEVFVLGLQHFLREMGLVYQITYFTKRKMNHKVLQLPGLAVDLLLYGVPLEIMAGDICYIPVEWLACVISELQRRLPQEQLRTKVLTTAGAHSVRNAELLSSVFNVSFYDEGKACSRGIYMLGLRVPTDLQSELNCDFLLLLDVEGLCAGSDEYDNEMATVAAGLSDIFIGNISSHSSSKFDTIISVLVNALLCVSERGSIPICQIVCHDDNINTILQARLLNRVCQILQAKSGVDKTSRTVTTTVPGPWNNKTLSEPVDPQYGNALMTLKNHLINAIKVSSACSGTTSLPLFMGRLCSIWDAVRTSSFTISLQKTDIALSFSILCTELSQWESTLEEHMERWLMEAIQKIFTTKITLDATEQHDLLDQLKSEAHTKVITEIDAVALKMEAHCEKDQYLKIYSDRLKPVLSNNMDDLKERVTHTVIERLMRASKSHCSSTQLGTFQTQIQKELEIKLCELMEYSKANKILLNDQKLEEEFKRVWSKKICDVDLQLSETEDITARVRAVLRQNLISRGLHKHIKNMETLGLDAPEPFQICKDHTVHNGSTKHMLNDKKYPRFQAQKVASWIIVQYNQFIVKKSGLHSEFSESYITELLKNIEKTLKDKHMEQWSVFEVDLKVYLCSVACKDFQKLHNRYNKDKLLASINTTKTASLARFMYQFRKRDQGQRVAHTFTTQAIKPIVLDYIYAPLSMQIVEEILTKCPQYKSPLAFYRSLLEELLSNDIYRDFLDFWLSYDIFRQGKIQESVLSHISESSSINKWRQQRLGEIIGKIAYAVSQTGEARNGSLSDVKSLLENVYLTLEKDIDVDITRAALEGPLFDISTDWDRFVTCLMEELAAMRLELSQEFSQSVNAESFLQQLAVRPQDYLFERLRGCRMSCPFCSAPCEANDRRHEVHRVSLHRPNALLPSELSVEAENMSPSTEVCEDTPTADPDMNICGAQSTRTAPYWRYVLSKFSEHIQSEVPEEWKKTTQEEALNCLREVFDTELNM